jgi:hypothetical protein
VHGPTHWLDAREAKIEDLQHAAVPDDVVQVQVVRLHVAVRDSDGESTGGSSIERLRPTAQMALLARTCLTRSRGPRRRGPVVPALLRVVAMLMVSKPRRFGLLRGGCKVQQLTQSVHIAATEDGRGCSVVREAVGVLGSALRPERPEFYRVEHAALSPH